MMRSVRIALCAGAILLAGTCSREAKTTGTHRGAPVIIISVDTLRADHLPAYGYRGVETPAIDALRRDSILYANAWAHVPLTLPSHVSILTGQLPPENGVRNNIGFPFDSAAHPSIPTMLKQKGYATGAAVSAYVLRGNTGLARAFDFYDDDIPVKAGEAVGRLQRPGAESEAVAERWIDAQGDVPFFFLLHIFEPHTPYDPPEPFRSRYASRPYDGEVATADAVVGTFLEHLKHRGIYERAVVIFLSDHGEGLGDHGEDEHGIFLYREDLHVPLMVKLPRSERAGEEVSAPVQLIDVYPTIAQLQGVKPQNVRGTSLLQPPVDRSIYSETLYPRIHLGWSDLRSIVDSHFHFIDAPRPELYAHSDFGETVNVLEQNRRVFASMRKELEPFGRDLPSMGAIDPEEAKKLAALGYLSRPANATGTLADPKDRIGDLNLLRQATELDRRGSTAQAIAILRDVTAKNANLTDAWTLLASLLEKSGRYAEAIDAYRHCIDVAPSIAGELALSLANVLLIEHRPDEAAKYAELGLKTNPGNAHLLAGRAALEKKDFGAAEREAEEASQTPSYRLPATVLLADIRAQQERLTEASALVQRAFGELDARKGEAPPQLYYVKGDVLARMNRTAEAIAAFDEEIRRFPHDPRAYVSLAVVYFVTGEPSKSEATMERLAKSNPSPSSCEVAAKTFAELGLAPLAAQWEKRAKSLRR